MTKLQVLLSRLPPFIKLLEIIANIANTKKGQKVIGYD